MPPVSRAFILTGLLYLLAAMIVGLGLMLGPVGFRLPAALGPMYVHLLAVGWITQLIFGVAHWMFPARARDPSLRSRAVTWACYALLNAGLLARAVAEPLVARAGPWPAIVAASAAAQLTAVLLFVFQTWPRVRAR
jgi:hypothetical protein